MLIQPGTLKKICTTLNVTRAGILEGFINSVCPQYGITTDDILHEFLANVIEESGEFRTYEEGLSYVNPERIQAVWPSRFPTVDSALPYVHNPKALAEKVYGNRKDLGNVQPGDGFAFRGSGPIQLTGRNIFTLFAGYMRTKFNIIKDVYTWADLLRTSDEYGMHSASWFFAIAKNLIQLAIDDNMKEIVHRINGGYTNMSTRLKYYELCKQYIIPAPPSLQGEG